MQHLGEPWCLSTASLGSVANKNTRWQGPALHAPQRSIPLRPRPVSPTFIRRPLRRTSAESDGTRAHRAKWWASRLGAWPAGLKTNHTLSRAIPFGRCRSARTKCEKSARWIGLALQLTNPRVRNSRSATTRDVRTSGVLWSTTNWPSPSSTPPPTALLQSASIVVPGREYPT